MKFSKSLIVGLFLNQIQAIKISDDDNGLNLPAIVDEHDNFADKQIMTQIKTIEQTAS
jgi:hypothetical protein